MDLRRRQSSSSLFAGWGALALGGLSGCVHGPAARLGAEQGQASTEPPRSQTSRSNEPALQLGQAWEFQATNLYNGENLGTLLHRVQALDATGINLALIDGRSTRTEIFSEPWKLMQEAHHDAILRFESPVALIPTKLETGTREQYSTRYRVVAPATPAPADSLFKDLFWQVYLEVLGWQTIQVAAGRFEVARVRRSIYFKHFDSFRSESSRRETLWYSPALGYWVAREWTGQYLLPGGRKRGGQMLEDKVRWELVRRWGAPSS